MGRTFKKLDYRSVQGGASSLDMAEPDVAAGALWEDPGFPPEVAMQGISDLDPNIRDEKMLDWKRPSVRTVVLSTQSQQSQQSH